MRLENFNRPLATERPAALGSSLCGFQTAKDMVKDGRHHERTQADQAVITWQQRISGILATTMQHKLAHGSIVRDTD